MSDSFSYLKIVKIEFHVPTPSPTHPLSPCGPFWSAKYPNFGQKLPILTGYHMFLEYRYPEDTKNPYYVLPFEVRRKKLLSRGLKVEIDSAIICLQLFKLLLM